MKLSKASVDYPDELIDPKIKQEKEWHLQYAKAAWNDAFSGAFYGARDHYHTIRLYTQSQQPISKYYPSVGVDEQDSHTWLNLDWKPLPIIPKFRQIAISRMGASDYKVECRAIDPLAIEEDNKHFKKLEAKIKLREQAEKINPELKELDPLKAQKGEPLDDEEMELYKLYTYKNKWSQEMELGIRYVFVNSGAEEEIAKVRLDMVDFGVGAARERFGANGEIVTEHVPVQDMVVSPCRKRDFTDMRHAGVIRRLTIGEIEIEAGRQLTYDEKARIVQQTKSGALHTDTRTPVPTTFSINEMNNHMVDVLDLEILSMDEAVFECRTDSRGNTHFGRAPYNKKMSDNPKYSTKKYRSLYGCKWIINTGFLYDYGRKDYQLRSVGNLAETRTSFHIYAPDLYEGKSYGLTERMIPHADSVQRNWLKIQQMVTQAKPKGVAIDLDAFEAINFGAGGKKMDWRDVIKMHGQLGSIPYRNYTRHGQHRGGDGAPVKELENGVSRDLPVFVDLINHDLQMLRQITGVNEMVDGSSPNPRLLSAAARLGVEASNNALRHIKDGEVHIVRRLARSISDRIKQALEKGRKFEGMIQALGSDTVEFLSMSKDTAHRQFSINIVEVPTDADREEMLEWAKAYAGEGLISIEDYSLIKTTDNLKLLSHILAHKVSKRKKEMQAQQERNQMITIKGQQESAVVASQAEQQTLQLEYNLKMQLVQREKDLELRNQKELAGIDAQVQQMKEASKLTQKGMEISSKETPPASDSPMAIAAN